MKTFLHAMFVISAIVCLFSCSEKNEIAPPYLNVDMTEISPDMSGEEVTVNVESNRKVTVTSQASWLRYVLTHNPASEAGTIRISVNPNNSMHDRTTRLTLSADGCEPVHILISQSTSLCAISSFMIPSEANQLKEDIVFNLDHYESVFSAKYLKWIEKDEPDMFIPVFESSGDVYHGERKIVSGVTPISLADDIVLTVRGKSGNSADYMIVLNCPQINTELPVLHMRPDRLIDSKDNYVDTYIELFDRTPGSTGEGWWDSAEKGKIEMRGRGNSTWGLPKKPFRMKFTEKFSPIGLDHAKEKSWVLLAQDMDKSLLRTHIAFEYSRELFNRSEGYHDANAVLFTPASQYINVYFTGDYYDSSTGKTERLDGDYLGVWQMSDQMERAKGRIEVDKLEASDGDDPEKITGGYIIESDIHEGSHYSSIGVKFSYKYPKDDDCDPAQYEYISDFIDAAEAALWSDDYKDPDNGWRKYFDEKTLADFVIIKELVQDMDGYTSTYAYKRRGCDKLFFGPVWDCDKGWDNERRNSHAAPLENLMIHSGFRMPGVGKEDWYQRLWTDESFRAFVAKRWAQKKEDLLEITENVLAQVPSEMSKAIEANFTVWPFSYQHSTEAKAPAGSYDLEIQRIRDLTIKRAALLDKLFNK